MPVVVTNTNTTGPRTEETRPPFEMSCANGPSNPHSSLLAGTPGPRNTLPTQSSALRLKTRRAPTSPPLQLKSPAILPAVKRCLFPRWSRAAISPGATGNSSLINPLYFPLIGRFMADIVFLIGPFRAVLIGQHNSTTTGKNSKRKGGISGLSKQTRKNKTHTHRGERENGQKKEVGKTVQQ